MLRISWLQSPYLDCQTRWRFVVRFNQARRVLKPHSVLSQPQSTLGPRHYWKWHWSPWWWCWWCCRSRCWRGRWRSSRRAWAASRRRRTPPSPSWGRSCMTRPPSWRRSSSKLGWRCSWISLSRRTRWSQPWLTFKVRNTLCRQQSLLITSCDQRLANSANHIHEMHLESFNWTATILDYQTRSLHATKIKFLLSFLRDENQ